MWQSHIYSLNKRSWLHGEITIKYENTIFIVLSLKISVEKSYFGNDDYSQRRFFFCTLLKFMQGDNVQVENTKSGGGGEGGFTMAWYHVIHELLLIGCSLVGCLVPVSWLSHCSEHYKFAYFLPRLLPVRRSTAVRIIWKWPLHWRFLYFL